MHGSVVPPPSDNNCNMMVGLRALDEPRSLSRALADLIDRSNSPSITQPERLLVERMICDLREEIELRAARYSARQC
jgi:hypothetical protein